MRLLHTADWHLGRLFHNLSLLDDQRHVLQQLLEIIDREQVDAVLVAGDIYDRSVPPAAAVTLLDEILVELCEQRGLPVVMISGHGNIETAVSAIKSGAYDFIEKPFEAGEICVGLGVDQCCAEEIARGRVRRFCRCSAPGFVGGTDAVADDDGAIDEICGADGSGHQRRRADQ